MSLTSHIVKIFERFIRKRLAHHLESNNLLCTQQHGFRSGHSCLTQMLHHFDNILENFLDGNEYDTDCIYLDYAKAFDKVDHALLIRKLSKYGIHPKIITWIESFLQGRTQQVVVEGQLSFAALIISGVPQGTVLGPILFLIFINDITHCVSSSVIRCFADDTRIMKAISHTPDMTLYFNMILIESLSGQLEITCRSMKTSLNFLATVQTAPTHCTNCHLHAKSTSILHPKAFSCPSNNYGTLG